jgi:TrmH family RNA methyltransferase
MSTFETITSPSNPRVRAAAALRAADARRDTGLTLVDGRRECARAVAAGAEVVELFVATTVFTRSRPDSGAFAEWLGGLTGRGTPLSIVAEKPFERLAFGSRNEGVVAVVRWQAAALDAVTFAVDRPVLVIEGVEKPGNLGAILRTADAAGLAGVVVCDGRTDPANPAVIRASLGTVFAVPLAVGTTVETIRWCASHGRRVVAATPTGQLLWHEAALAGNTAVLLGSEAHGITPAWQQAATAGSIAFDTVRLPMHGVADSLNLSVTAAVLAYEAVRQMEQCR